MTEGAHVFITGRRDVELAAAARELGKDAVRVAIVTGEPRYRLLESMRQYALERLEAAGETSAIRSRHLDVFVALAHLLGAMPMGQGKASGIAGCILTMRTSWPARLVRSA